MFSKRLSGQVKNLQGNHEDQWVQKHQRGQAHPEIRQREEQKVIWMTTETTGRRQICVIKLKFKQINGEQRCQK